MQKFVVCIPTLLFYVDAFLFWTTAGYTVKPVVCHQTHTTKKYLDLIRFPLLALLTRERLSVCVVPEITTMPFYCRMFFQVLVLIFNKFQSVLCKLS